MTTALLHRVDLSPFTEAPVAPGSDVAMRAANGATRPVELALVNTPAHFEALEREWITFLDQL